LVGALGRGWGGCGVGLRVGGGGGGGGAGGAVAAADSSCRLGDCRRQQFGGESGGLGYRVAGNIANSEQ
jgi:hypothetical protein